FGNCTQWQCLPFRLHHTFTANFWPVPDPLPAADGSFSACFGANGLTVGQNSVRITYNGAPLTTPSLPSFTIAINGSLSISVSAAMTAGLTLNSYSLPN